MTTAENLLKVSEGLDKVESLNTELAQSLYGGDTGYRGHYDEFWDAYQSYGKRNNYSAAFAGKYWLEDTFKPKYDINNFNTGQLMFWNSDLAVDLPAYLDKCGVTLDFSKSINAAQAFAFSKFSRIGILDFSIIQNGDGAFSQATNLVTIDKIIVSPNTYMQSTWFGGCNALVNVTFEGELNKSGLNFKDCPKLSKASITSVINALSATTSGLSVTLSKTAVTSAFGSTTSAEWTNLIGTKSNWTINLV